MISRRLVLAAALSLVCMQPGGTLAQVTGDGLRPSGGQPVLQTGRVSFSFEAPRGTHGRGPDPDDWDFATSSGTFWAALDGVGTREVAPAGTVDNCVTSNGHDSISLELPAMSIGSNPAPPRDSGLGGVVNDESTFWVIGYSGEGRAAEREAHVSVTNCVLDTSTDPPTMVPRTEEHTASLGYRAGSAALWNWGDGPTLGSGWSGVGHTFRVSSGRCLASPTCIEVPVKGRLYVIEFRFPMDVDFIYDGVVTPLRPPYIEVRHRGYPVREVQSILDR